MPPPSPNLPSALTLPVTPKPRTPQLWPLWPLVLLRPHQAHPDSALYLPFLLPESSSPDATFPGRPCWPPVGKSQPWTPVLLILSLLCSSSRSSVPPDMLAVSRTRARQLRGDGNSPLFCSLLNARTFYGAWAQEALRKCSRQGGILSRESHTECGGPFLASSPAPFLGRESSSLCRCLWPCGQLEKLLEGSGSCHVCCSGLSGTGCGSRPSGHFPQRHLISEANWIF